MGHQKEYQDWNFSVRNGCTITGLLWHGRDEEGGQNIFGEFKITFKLVWELFKEYHVTNGKKLLDTGTMWFS